MMGRMSIVAFLSRPDVREAPLRLSLRRAFVALLGWLSPSLLTREITFKTTDGLRFRGPLSDTVHRDLFVHGTFEWASQKVWREALRPGGVAVDVGAHVGSFTLPAALAVGAQGRVLAFEPNAVNRVRLERNLRLNDLSDQVTVFPFALLDHDSITELGSPDPRNSGMSRLGVAGANVECRRMDDVLDATLLGRVDALKIDVEGAEMAALVGGLNILAVTQTVIAEVNDTGLLSFLLGQGFLLTTSTGEPFRAPETHRAAGEALNVVGRRAMASPVGSTDREIGDS